MPTIADKITEVAINMALALIILSSFGFAGLLLWDYATVVDSHVSTSGAVALCGYIIFVILLVRAILTDPTRQL